MSNWVHAWDDSVIDRNAGSERIQSYDLFSISSVLIIGVGLYVGIYGWIYLNARVRSIASPMDLPLQNRTPTPC
ncbi:hypothetical protein EAH74_27015 [Pseudomonas mandelii]|uniref:Uncharacterized protein n=1 Tax=Pseudomonas mandelii TaxID=75612 RepID=A0A502HW61_9PSED|nr:hypothetical protein EAH74_27015 [Pseudomonas mandelii]